MIKIRIRNAGHEIDVQFPISENKLYAKLAEIHAIEGKDIETWFDVDKKFHIDTASDDDTWLNMYGRYNPFDDTLRIECEINRQDNSSYFDYEPTKDEAQLIKDMIAEKIQEDYHQTPQEFCEEYCGEDQTIGGIK